MPQLLSKVTSKPGFELAAGGRRILMHHNPELGLLAMEVIVSWTTVESFFLSLYLDLLGGTDDIAATAYMALETQSAKIAVIQAVARERLDEDHLKLLNAILGVAKTYQKGRDKLAHWTWGYTGHLKDAFLLADPKDCRPFPTPDKIYVYTKRDFEDLIKGNDRLCGFGLSFNFILRGHVSNRDGRLYAELCAEPEIQERLARQP